MLSLCVVQDKAQDFKATILSDAFWQVVEQAVQLYEPIVKLLRIADGDSPSVGKIHSRAYAVQQHLAVAHMQLQIPQAVARLVQQV